MFLFYPKRLHLVHAVFGVLFFALSSAHAQKITPSTVFQITEDIILQLERMHDANFSKPDFSKVNLDIPNRLPRHVIQQALNIRIKIQSLKQVNGMDLPVIETPEVREVVPADVLSVTEQLLNELTDFNKEFKLSPFKRSAPLVDGKTPTDVYRNLLKIQTMVEQLGIPPTVPNDVFNVAKVISNELEQVQIAVGNLWLDNSFRNSKGKSPANAYDSGYQLLSLLSELVQKDGYQIPKSVILPEKLTSGITPADVQQILLYSLAEISSIKVATGVTDKLVLLEPTGGQTPSSVFDQINIAIDQTNSLIGGGTAE